MAAFLVGAGFTVWWETEFCAENPQNKRNIQHINMEKYLVLKKPWFFFFAYRKTVVCPIIDVISDDTFEYMAGSDMTYGGFNWKLNFRWYPVPQREMDRRKGDRTLPVR